MKINYKKANPWFFLIGATLCLFICFSNKRIFDISNDGFLLMLFLSEILCAGFFYRFNNGLIALLRGSFAKPSKKDKKFVDYTKPKVETAQEIKQAVSYGEKCLIMYKLNSRTVYQIYKQGNRLVVHKCFPDKEQNSLVCDFDEAKTEKNDWFIPLNEIKSVTFGISKSNYDLPVFSINRKNKNYRFIGYFEPVSKELLKLFFADIRKVYTINGEQTAKRNSEIQEKTKFLYNLLHLSTAMIAPCMISVWLIRETGAARILGSLYMIIALVLLLLCLLIVILNKNKLILDYDNKNKNDSTRELFFEFVVINIALYLAVLAKNYIINTGYFLVLVAVIFVALTILYFKTNPVKKPKNSKDKEDKLARYALVSITVFVIGVSSVNLILGANYVLPVKTTAEYYAIAQAEINTDNTDLYYVTIKIEGKEKVISVSKQTIEKNSSFVEATKTRGILGIEYIKESQ